MVWAVKTCVSCCLLPFLMASRAFVLVFFSAKMNRRVETRFNFLCFTTGSRNRKVEMLLKFPQIFEAAQCVLDRKKKIHPNNSLFHTKSTWKPAQWSYVVWENSIWFWDWCSCCLANLKSLYKVWVSSGRLVSVSGQMYLHEQFMHQRVPFGENMPCSSPRDFAVRPHTQHWYASSCFPPSIQLVTGMQNPLAVQSLHEWYVPGTGQHCTLCCW